MTFDAGSGWDRRPSGPSLPCLDGLVIYTRPHGASPACRRVVLLLCCLLSVEGRPSRNFALAKDERTVNTAEGKHTLDFEVLNHQKRKEIGKQDDGQSFSGSFDFVTGDGEAFEIMYVADGRGFLPQGEHLPVAPALPYHRVQPFPRSHKVMAFDVRSGWDLRPSGPCRALAVLLYVAPWSRRVSPSCRHPLGVLRTVEGHPGFGYPLVKDERTVITAEGKHTLDIDIKNGQKRKEIGKQDDGQSFSGSFGFVTDDGEAFEIVYEADRRGFLPKGEHLPVPPALPYHRVQSHK
ncbi:uncharacterized protein LOC143020480 [Oratosquilla oratoria]|uniref:uncharacterized protein LOC143020480 n=1 Tax=Oratosquilla oratoria TaxID=337810 RepID=UPI003F761EE8